jgi:hypothetical protein
MIQPITTNGVCFDSCLIRPLAESQGFDVFLTLDKGIEYQQNFSERKISILVVRAKSNRLRGT